MPRFSSWAHGTVGVCPILTPQIQLASLQYTLTSNDRANIFFPIPTPVIVNGNRARLERVFVLYWLDPGVTLGPVFVYDGQNDPGEFDPDSTGQTEFNVSVTGPQDHTGVNGLNDLIPNVTQFDFTPEQPLVYFGLVLVVGVRFSPVIVNQQERARTVLGQWGLGGSGIVRFTSVGADFLV